jgi:biotin transport system substrate-specific component
MTHATYADVFRPAEHKSALAYDFGVVIAGSALLALSARLSFHLGPIPFTCQTLAVVLLGALLGSRHAVASVAAYLLEGAMGAPVFAGGAFGAAYMAGPTGGYLAGFIVAAWLTGLLAERGWDRNRVASIAAMVAGDAVIFLFGVAWLACHIGFGKAVTAGLAPFVLGDAIKLAVGGSLLPLGWKIIKK